MKIITISREFGSGGRELGKRLADLMGFDYYDREIIAAIAESRGLDLDYVEKTLDGQAWRSVPLHFRSTLASGAAMQQPQTRLLLEQKNVLEAVARLGRNCVLVGRNADVILRRHEPFSIFVCADMEAKILRCMERAGEGEGLSRREMERKIRSVDKGRAQIREMITGSRWGDRSAYHLTVNTSEWNIKELAPAVAEYANRWFERTKK